MIHVRSDQETGDAENEAKAMFGNVLACYRSAKIFGVTGIRRGIHFLFSAEPVDHDNRNDFIQTGDI